MRASVLTIVVHDSLPDQIEMEIDVTLRATFESEFDAVVFADAKRKDFGRLALILILQDNEIAYIKNGTHGQA